MLLLLLLLLFSQAIFLEPFQQRSMAIGVRGPSGENVPGGVTKVSKYVKDLATILHRKITVKNASILGKNK